MHRCSKCHRPLSKFELAFHEEANSPTELSTKCWRCCGAEDDFAPAKLGTPSHTLEIILCLLACVAIIVILMPIIPHWNEPADELTIEVYATAYVIIGSLVTAIIFQRRKNRKAEKALDPPEERIGKRYSLTKTSLVTTKRYDGTYVTEKVTEGGESEVDQWNRDDGSTLFGKIINFYTSLISITINIVKILLLGTVFVAWVIPYIIIVFFSDIRLKARRAAIPSNLRRAYKRARIHASKATITFDDKVDFLINREKLQNAKPSKSGFISQYSGNTPTASTKCPYLYTYKKSDARIYMIVDYRQGTTFVLTEGPSGDVEKCIIQGDEFLATNSSEWITDWHACGASTKTIQNISWLESEFNRIRKSSKRKKTISC